MVKLNRFKTAIQKAQHSVCQYHKLFILLNTNSAQTESSSFKLSNFFVLLTFFTVIFFFPFCYSVILLFHVVVLFLETQKNKQMIGLKQNRKAKRNFKVDVDVVLLMKLLFLLQFCSYCSKQQSCFIASSFRC